MSIELMLVLVVLYNSLQYCFDLKSSDAFLQGFKLGCFLLLIITFK